jgi:hypothetical protein
MVALQHLATHGTDPSTSNTLTDVQIIHIIDIHIDNGDLASVDQTKQKLRLNYVRFFNNRPDYTGILREIIPPTKHLYAICPHREP